MKKIAYIFLLTVFIFSAGCNSKKTTESQEDSHAGMDMESVDNEEGLGTDAELTDDMNVFFVNLEDGATVTSPVLVEMGVNGMEVEPAGELAKHKGHHHIIVDGSFSPLGVVVPADSTHIHFGQGQTSTELTLTPGSHTLTLQFADGFHRSYGEQMSATISITVE